MLSFLILSPTEFAYKKQEHITMVLRQNDVFHFFIINFSRFDFYNAL